MNWTKFAARAAAFIVAVVAGAASFSHIADVAIAAGERIWVAYALPLAIDGLIVVGVAALIEDNREERVPRKSARLAVLLGVVATLAANVASAEPHLEARLVAVAAPVAFLISVEVLTRSGRKKGIVGAVADVLTTEQVVDGSALPAETPVGTPTETPAAVKTEVAEGEGKREGRRRERRGAAAQRVADILKQNPDAAKNISKLAMMAETSWGTAKRVVDGV